MAEQTFPLEVAGIKYVCDSCGIGTMQADNVVLDCYPPQYPHKCNHCGATATFTECYPTVRHLRQGD